MSTFGASGDASTGPSADPTLTHPHSDAHELATALVTAFSDRTVDVDPEEREPLHEWLCLDAVEALFASSPDAQVETVVWDHRVVLTADAVQVFERVEDAT